MLILKYVYFFVSFSDPFIFKNKFGSTVPSGVRSVRKTVLVGCSTNFCDYFRRLLSPGRILNLRLSDLVHLAGTIWAYLVVSLCRFFERQALGTFGR